MIYELRTYTVKPGTLGDMVKAASTVSRDIRGDNYGKLEGYWFTEIGPLNQVMHMWSYSDLNERARLRAELAKNARWAKEYVPLLHPILMHQQVRLMHAIRARPLGAVRQWIEAFTAALPAREQYSKIVGLWHSETPQPNEVCHIWAYPDLNARAQARAAALADPVWKDFLTKGPPLLEEMHSTIMLPAPHSPLQ
jgi:hypothetical protein